MRARWKSISVFVAVLATLAAAVPASAKPAPVTKIKFKLDTHEAAVGETITLSVHVWSREGNAWTPIPSAVLSLFVDGEVDALSPLTTGLDGSLEVAYTAADEGDHVMKVVFDAIEGHKKAQRAQGFSVSAVVAASTATVPEAPVLAATTGTGVVSLSWTVPADGGSPITHYSVFRVDSTGTQTMNATIAGGTSTLFDDFSAAPGIEYTYAVAAVNAVGPGPWSNAVTLTAA
jgi:hypothetical protein